MPDIHPTAIISPEAVIDPSAVIGPFVVIDGPVTIGPRTVLMAGSQVLGRTTLGAGNTVHPYAVIGGAPQHLTYREGTDSGTRIGDGNTFREMVTVNRAHHAGNDTVIGNGCFLMSCSHVGHDCVLGDNVIMANSALLGGHVHVGDGANLSGNVAVHQFVRIGTLAMIGGLSKVVKDVPPFMVLQDQDIHGLNTVGLRRAGFELSDRKRVKEAYKRLYRTGLNVPSAIVAIEADADLMSAEPARRLVAFVRASVRGICRHADIRRGGTPDEGVNEAGGE